MTAYISAILKDKITNEDVTNIISKEAGLKPDYLIPSMYSQGFGVTFGTQGNLKKIGDLKNCAVMVANLVVKTGEVGIIQLTPKKAETEHEMEILMSEMDDLIFKTEIKERVISYELYVNFIKDGKDAIQRKIILPELKTMEKPMSFGLRIFEGDLTDQDIRIQPWKQINIEPVVQDPTKLTITMIFRNKHLEKNIISKGYEDLEKLLNFLKEEK